MHRPGFLPQEPPHLGAEGVSSRDASACMTLCFNNFITASDGTSCTHALLLLTLGGTCALSDRQGFSVIGSLLAPLWGKRDEERVQQQHKHYI